MVLPHDATRPIGVVYATREGHSHRVADHIAAVLRGRGLAVIVAHVADDGRRILFDELGMVIAIASVHRGAHEPEMVEFARRHAAALMRRPAAFISVSLGEATAEDPAADPEARLAASQAVHAALQRFFADTGWHPAQVLPIAGCIAYSRYGVLDRLLVRRIIGPGAPVDTSRDHELTDWTTLDRFVNVIVSYAEQHGAGLRHV